MSSSRQVRIRVSGVVKRFGDKDREVEALGPIDVDVLDGEFLCVVGPSGCGKSTLLRLMGGLLRPSDGFISIDRSGSGARTIAMVFQEYGIYPWKTVVENVKFGLEIAGRTSEAEAQARKYIEMMSLQDFENTYPHQLSGGMRQRVAIARALAVEPEILLLDEPFAALDAQLRMVMQRELLRIWELNRRTVVFVTHSLEEAILLGDRILVLSSRPGRVKTSESVPFERPRDPDLRSKDDFVKMRRSLWERLESEVEVTRDE